MRESSPYIKYSMNDQYFKQMKGLPMESCLLPVLSNLYMEYFEKEFLQSVVDYDLVWYSSYRYVDDIFIILHDCLSILYFLARLNNSLLPSINFKVEIENNQSLQFLDVLIKS